MAERRMFSKSIMESDNFLNLSDKSKILYLYLNLSADDDGFVGSTRKLISFTEASQENLDELIQTKYVYRFESGVCVIRHWKAHNYLRNDRYHPTLFQNELSQLTFNEKTRTYERYTDGIPKVDAVKTRLEEISIDQTKLVETSEDESRLLELSKFKNEEDAFDNYNIA